MDGLNTEAFFHEEDECAVAQAIPRPNGADHVHGASGNALTREALADLFDVKAWAQLEIAPEPRLLGHLITPSARVFLVGRTGLGKTLFAHALAAGMAAGQGFLHWRSDRPSRWLIIDGEMPTALLKMRATDLLRRAGEIVPGFLTIYSADRAEEFAQLFPGLGFLEPLNTEAGQKFVLRLAQTLEVEGIIFDNIMSLVAGDQKDEVPWSQTLPLVTELSRSRIAQIYLDHTGHNTDRQYGSATKAWRMDAVGIMTPLTQGQHGEPGEVAFNLSFEPPGKARRRTPENWREFETTIIRLGNDRWTSEPAMRDGTKLSPVGKLWYAAFLDALCRSNTPGRTTRTEWFADAVRTNLVESIEPNDSRAARDRKMAKLRKYAIELRAAGLIGIDG